MDMLAQSVETVAQKVEAANLTNVRVIQGDALNTELEKESFGEILMFGVIPAPMLPMDKLLAEMHCLLKPDGVMAVWPPSWVHQAIIQSGLFKYRTKQNGVINYRREGSLR